MSRRSSAGFDEVAEEFETWDDLADHLQERESVVCASRHLLALAGRSRWSKAAVTAIHRDLADRYLCLGSGVRDGDWVRVMPADGLLAAVHRAVAEPTLSGEGLLQTLGISPDEGSEQDFPHVLNAISHQLNDPRPRVSAYEQRLQEDFDGGVMLDDVRDDQVTYRVEVTGLTIEFPTDLDDYLMTAGRVTGASWCFRLVRDWFHDDDGWDIETLYWEIAANGLMSWFVQPRTGRVEIRPNPQLPSIVTFRERGSIDFLDCPPHLRTNEGIRRTRTGRWELLPTETVELAIELTSQSTDTYWK